MEHAKNLYGVEANAVDNDKRRTCYDQLPGFAKTAATAQVRVIRQVFHRFTYPPSHALRGGGLFPGDVFASFP